MKLLGFNLSKLSGVRHKAFKLGSVANTNIDFTDIDKEKVDVLGDIETLKIDFNFSVVYKEKEESKDLEGEISFQGTIHLAVEKEEAKNILKEWKKKDLSPNFKIPIFNLIIRKCSPKALFLEDEVSLPAHIPLPQLQSK